MSSGVDSTQDTFDWSRRRQDKFGGSQDAPYHLIKTTSDKNKKNNKHSQLITDNINMKVTFALLSIATIIGTYTPAYGNNYQNLRGKDTLLTDSAQLVEKESGSTEWPLVPSSHFFTHGIHGKKPQGDWEYPHHSGELVVHMSRPPHSHCTLTGKSGPYNFGEGHLHSDGNFCKHTKCWVFPICSPIHGNGKKNITCKWGHGQHQDCHVLIIQNPGHTYYHKTLQEELSKTNWKPYK